MLQIAALGKVPREAIWSAAFLLDELDENAIAVTARNAVNDQLTYMNDELKTMADHIGTVIVKEVGKHVETLTSAVKNITTAPSRTFKDALLNGPSAPSNINPRLLAREGIRACQFLIDFAAESNVKELSYSKITKRFNEAIVDSGGNMTIHRIRSVEHLANKGILGEFFNGRRS